MAVARLKPDGKIEVLRQKVLLQVFAVLIESHYSGVEAV